MNRISYQVYNPTVHNNSGKHPYDNREQNLHNPNSLKVKQMREIPDGILPSNTFLFNN